jgi:hypothetical protein
MPASACPTCSFTSFELTYLTSTERKAPETVRVVQCERCGTIAGVMEDNSQVLASIEKRLRNLEQKLKSE